MYAAILKNELGWFDEDENHSGQIEARLASDATNVRAAAGDRVALILQNGTLIIVSTIVSMVLQWKMAFVMIGGFPLVALSNLVEVRIVASSSHLTLKFATN
jgi:ATP-binding cassette subfamily B (MDR/TAP) protein 1